MSGVLPIGLQTVKRPNQSSGKPKALVVRKPMTGWAISSAGGVRLDQVLFGLLPTDLKPRADDPVKTAG